MIGDKRLLAGQYFVGNDGERELIRASIHSVPLHLLRRHVVRSAHHDSALRHLLRKNFGNAEVGDFGEGAFVDQDIGGLDIAVNDAFFVGVVEREGDLAQNGKHALGKQGLRAVQDLFKRRTIDELHEDIGQAVLFGNIVDGDDIGMGEDAGRLGLAEQALA